MLLYPEIAAISFLGAPGAAAGLIALGSVFREWRERAMRLGEVRHLNEMLRLDDELPSPAQRRHHEARLVEAIGGFTLRDYARSPEAQREVDAHLPSFSRRRCTVELLRLQTDEEDRRA